MPDLLPEDHHERRERRCLSCRNPFSSEWAGERVCQHCKRSAIWRSCALSDTTGQQRGRTNTRAARGGSS